MKAGATERVQRLLALVPHVAAEPDGVAVTELCERYGVDERQLLGDLTTLSFVGVPPYTPDTLVDVTVEDGRVWIRPQWFDRPLRLTPAQALALVVAGETLETAAAPDTADALARALGKLRHALGVEGQAVDVDLGPADPVVIDLLHEAVRSRRPVAIEYYSAGRDAHTQRVVEPWRVFADQGGWYLAARCRSAEGERVFRVDRISSAEVLDDRFEPPGRPPDPRVFDPGQDAPRVELELDPAGRWVAEQLPLEEATDLDGGRLRVRLAVGGSTWLARLLVRLGPTGRVVGGDPDLRRVGARAAESILARYAAGDDRGSGVGRG